MDKFLDYFLGKAVERYKSMNEVEKIAACIIFCIIITVGGFTWFVFKQHNIIQAQQEIIQKQEEALTKCNNALNQVDTRLGNLKNRLELENQIQEALKILNNR